MGHCEGMQRCGNCIILLVALPALVLGGCPFEHLLGIGASNPHAEVNQAHMNVEPTSAYRKPLNLGGLPTMGLMRRFSSASVGTALAATAHLMAAEVVMAVVKGSSRSAAGMTTPTWTRRGSYCDPSRRSTAWGCPGATCSSWPPTQPSNPWAGPC